MNFEQMIEPILAFLSYFVGGLGFLFLFMIVYLKITPYDEIKLIRDGNSSAAISLSGALIGFAFPLARAIEQSVGPLDLTIWAMSSLIVQSLVFWGISVLMPNLKNQIRQNKTANAIFLASMSVIVGMLMAASMTE